MNIELKENERIDDLEFKNLKIIQNKDWFCFGIDSVLLSDFAKDIKTNSKIIDLGTGTGILPILLSVKTNAKEIVGIEIQEEVANMAKRTVALNNLQEKLTNTKTTTEEKNKVYEEIKTLNTNSGLENTLEDKIEKEYNCKNFTKIENNTVKVIVDKCENSKTLANNIMRLVQQEFDNKMYISVQFK